jgi:predicted enzyme related to lactoylglutathione lyase
MSNAKDESMVGTILWQDLTIENAVEVRDFYRKIIGWGFLPEDMGEYQDYHMIVPSTGNSVAGICHPRGVNADIPPVWLIYISVEDVEESARICEQLGGSVITGPRQMGVGRVCVIRDPAGAVCALYQPQNSS